MPTFIAIRTTSRTARVNVPAVNVVPAPSGLAAAAVGSGGTFAAGSYFWKVTAVGPSGGETSGSNEATATLVLNGSANLTWTAVSGVTSYRVYRGTTAGAENVLVATVTTNSYTDTGAAGSAATVPANNTAYSNATTKAQVSYSQDTVVNVDDVKTRKALNSHNAIGQFIVTGANNSTSSAGTLPANT